MEPFQAKPKRKKAVRETGRGGTEQAGRKRVRDAGGESLKWTSPGMNGVPDQIELYGTDAMGLEALMRGHNISTEDLVAILAAAIRFTEYKAPGKEPTKNQLSVHARLRSRGFTVQVVDYLKVPNE